MTGSFDGHANCFVESGDGKGLLIDLNYDTEPCPASTRSPDRPIQPAEETELNHWGKLAFRWMFWNVLLPGRHPDAGLTCRWPESTPRSDQHARHHHRRPRGPGQRRGFLTVYDEWDEDLAKNLAAQIGIDLTDAHWKADPVPARGHMRPDESVRRS